MHLPICVHIFHRLNYKRVVKLNSGARLHRFISLLHHLLAVCPCISYLSSLCLSFLICRMKTIIEPEFCKG